MNLPPPPFDVIRIVRLKGPAKFDAPFGVWKFFLKGAPVPEGWVVLTKELEDELKETYTIKDNKFVKFTDSPKNDKSFSKLYPRERYSAGKIIAIYFAALFGLILFWGVIFSGFEIFK